MQTLPVTKATLLNTNNKKSTTFIKLVGMPAPDLVDPKHSLGLGLASSVEAAQLNALSFPNILEHESPSSKVIDTIDGDNEDPFTLDSFASLIKAHLDAGKDFLIARVLTVEEKEEQKRFYYNYYSAHQINRSLFRTQPEEGLLHRMKAKNPMNNLNIIGDVHYYMIKASEYTEPKLVIATLEESIDKSTNIINGDSSLSRRKSESDTFPNATDANHIRSSSVSDIQLSNNDGNVTTYTAFYYATDDDYLMRRYVREYFKRNALNPEDIFLFTLFGASQHTGESFSSPFVSDPTNAAAVALPLERAVSEYLTNSGHSIIQMSPSDNEALTLGLWQRLRSRFISIPTTETAPTRLTPEAWIHHRRREILIIISVLLLIGVAGAIANSVP